MPHFGVGAIEVIIRHPIFHEWVLDFNNRVEPQEDGRFRVANNLILINKLSNGGFWRIDPSRHGHTIRATAGNFDGWFLDFNNDVEPRQSNSTRIADNVILATPEGRGAHWRIEESGRGISIQATAGRYEGWYLDFNADAGVERDGSRLTSSNLILAERPPRPGLWNFLPEQIQLRTADGATGDSLTIDCGLDPHSKPPKLVSYVLPKHYEREGFSRNTTSDNGDANVEWFVANNPRIAVVKLSVSCNRFGSARAEVKSATGKLVND